MLFVCLCCSLCSTDVCVFLQSVSAFLSVSLSPNHSFGKLVIVDFVIFAITFLQRVNISVHARQKLLLLIIWNCMCKPGFVYAKYRVSCCGIMSNVSFRLDQVKAEL